MIARIQTRFLFIKGLKDRHLGGCSPSYPHHLLGCICELTSWIQTILQPIMKEHAKLQTQIQMFANTTFI